MPVREDAALYDVANRDLASLIDEEVTPFTELVDWWQKDDLQRQMRSRRFIVAFRPEAVRGAGARPRFDRCQDAGHRFATRDSNERLPACRSA